MPWICAHAGWMDRLLGALYATAPIRSPADEKIRDMNRAELDSDGTWSSHQAGIVDIVSALALGDSKRRGAYACEPKE